jgi:hypothetical protein
MRDFQPDDSLDQAPQTTHKLPLEPAKTDNHAGIAHLVDAKASDDDFSRARQASYWI